MTVTYPPAPSQAPTMRPGRSIEGRSSTELNRLARIIELRTAILDGTYEVSTTDVADAMIALASRA